MKRGIIFRVCIVVIVPIGITVRSRNKSTAFFRSAGGDLNSLRIQLANIQSKLGIGTWGFNFRIPKDQKLVATFIAKLNGEVVPVLSGVYHILPTDKSRANEGSIFIYFYPVYLTKTPQNPTWELHFSVPNTGLSVVGMESPFDPSVFTLYSALLKRG